MVLSLGDTTQNNSSIRLSGGYLEKEEAAEKQLTRAQKLIFDLSFHALPSFEEEDVTLFSSPRRIARKESGKIQDANPVPKDDSRLAVANAEPSNSQPENADDDQISPQPRRSSARRSILPKVTTTSVSNGRESPKNKTIPSAKVEAEVKTPDREWTAEASPYLNTVTPTKENEEVFYTPPREDPKYVSSNWGTIVTPSPEEGQVPKTLSIPSRETNTPATSASTNSGDAMIAQLEMKLQAMQNLLQQNQEQLQVLTNENSKLHQELSQRPNPCEACGELQNAVQLLQQEAAAWKVERLKVAPAPNGELQDTLEKLQQETRDWKQQMQESLQKEKVYMMQHFKEQLLGMQSKGTKFQKEARDSASKLVEENKEEMRQTKEALLLASTELKKQMEQQVANIQSIRAFSQEAQEEGRKAQQSIKELQADAKLAQQKLEENQRTIQALQKERDEALLQQGAQLQAAADERKKLMVGTNAQLAQVLETAQTTQKETASLRVEFTKRLEAKEAKILELEANQQAMQAANEDIQQKLEQQAMECNSLRLDLAECRMESKKDKECISKLKEELSVTKQRFQEVEASLESVKKEHQEAIKTLEGFDAEGKQFMQQSWEDNSAALTLAHERVADLEETFRKSNEKRERSETKIAKQIEQQEQTIAEIQKDHSELQEVLAWTKTEKETVKGMMAEKEQVLQATKFELQDTRASLEAVTAEKDLVLDQLTANAEACMTAVTATEEMKALLAKEAKHRDQLEFTVASLEYEREELNKRLSDASAMLESLPDPETTADRRDSFPLDMEDLLSSMNMATDSFDEDDLFSDMNMPSDTFDDSFAFLGSMHPPPRSDQRRSTINALDELEADLRDLLNQSDYVLPDSHKTSARKASMLKAKSRRHLLDRKASVRGIERQMSILVAQKQRDSAEEEVLFQIRELN